MREKERQERVYVFIDGSNLYHGIKTNIGDGKSIPIDIRSFSELIAGQNRRLVKIYFYSAPVSQKEDKENYANQQRFLTALRKIHYLEVRLGRLVKRTKTFFCQNCKKDQHVDTHNEKGVDVRIASDLLVNAFDDQYDTAILVSEDSDFVPAVQEIRRLGKRVENAHVSRTAATGKKIISHLAQQCNRFIEIDKELISQCCFRKR